MGYYIGIVTLLLFDSVQSFEASRCFKTGVFFYGDSAKNIIDTVESSVVNGSLKRCYEGRPIDCGDVQKGCPSGVYKIYPKLSSRGFNVYCEMKIDGGGWTVFQKRYNGHTDFYRGWRAYTQGFGDPSREYWIGNRNLHRLTNQGSCELRIDMEDFDGNSAFAKYRHFVVGREATNFVLSVSGYYGTAGDSFTFQNGAPFSTKDRDNDQHPSISCAKHHTGAWWFAACMNSELNGEYFFKHPDKDWNGVNWNTWKGNKYSLKGSIMMIRRWESDIWKDSD